MRDQINTKGIVLTRTDFQEADRILTFLTPDHGKVRVIAKGVRRPRSKLAGGIELLSVSDISVLPGRGELGTLVSTRLVTHYGAIVQDLHRTMLAYDILKRLNRLTEDAAGEEYFNLLQTVLAGLDDKKLAADLTELWFTIQLLDITGYAPNLATDAAGQKLAPSQAYQFDFDTMSFAPQPDGPFVADHIKLLRLCLVAQTPQPLGNVQSNDQYLPSLLKLVVNLRQQTQS